MNKLAKIVCVFAVLAAGCELPEEEGGVGALCSADADCDAGLGCASDGTCMPVNECGACAGDEICILDTNECSQFCSSDAECASGCCHALQNGTSACLDASFCEDGNGGGGGSECNNRSQCMSGGASFPTGPGNCEGEVVGSFTNGCAETIECQICPIDAAGNVIAECHAARLTAGETEEGELSGHWWCGIAGSFDRWRYWCSLPEDPAECRGY